MSRSERFSLIGSRDDLERALRLIESARLRVQPHPGLFPPSRIDALADQTDATIRGMTERLAELASREVAPLSEPGH